MPNTSEAQQAAALDTMPAIAQLATTLPSDIKPEHRNVLVYAGFSIPCKRIAELTGYESGYVRKLIMQYHRYVAEIKQFQTLYVKEQANGGLMLGVELFIETLVNIKKSKEKPCTTRELKEISSAVNGIMLVAKKLDETGTGTGNHSAASIQRDAKSALKALECIDLDGNEVVPNGNTTCDAPDKPQLDPDDKQCGIDTTTTTPAT